MSSLPYKIKSDFENEVWRKYTAQCLKIITENTAGMVNGRFVNAEYEDIINPKPEEKRTAQDIINGIKNKIEELK